MGKDEAEQFAVRFLVASIVIIHTSIGEHPHDVQILSTSLSLAQLYGFGYFSTLILASLSAVYIRYNRPTIRIIMMLVDVAFFSAAMATTPESAAPLFFVYLLIVLGFGFRFGNKYLFAGMSLSLVGFVAAFLYSEYWHAHKSFAIGYLSVLLLVSLYVSLFIRRLNIAKLRLEEAVKKADEANQAKSKFLANMSHELRTPLNGVITVSDLLSDTKLSADQREYSDTIQSSARNLLELINNVLDFSKIESDKIVLDKICFDLHACIYEVIKIIKPFAEKKSLSIYRNISSDVPRFIYADPVRLKQILINLANNAVKFTDSGHISIHIYITESSSNQAHFCFEVIDTGIGISSDAQARIFERFVQEDDTTTRRFGGTGLGISIAKQLVELMGGAIGVTSKPGNGSRFWFEVDLDIASSEEFETLEADVLIITTSEKVKSSVGALLQGWGSKFVTRDNVESALKILNVWKHSKSKCTVILDEKTLHMSPVRAAQLIKESGVRDTTLLLSTNNPMQISNPGIDLYFERVLSSPIDSRQLYHALNKEQSDFAPQQGVVSLSSHISQLPTKQLNALNILVAEDQTTNQFVFKRILELAGHKVTIANDGQQALEILAVEKFDLTIVDLNMPNVSGTEVINVYKYMNPESNMPFVVVTANSSEDILSECHELAEAVLIKPIEKQQLLDVINKVVSHKPSITGYNEKTIQKSRFRTIPIMDPGILDDMLGKDVDDTFLSELFEVFVKDAVNLVQGIENNIYEIRKLPQAKSYAHALKGIANNVSALQLSAIAKYCEEEIQTNPDVLDKAEQIILELKKCLSTTKQTMRDYLSVKGCTLIDS
ncbi:MAG: ATP-binding protein [Gammaproteobacteria bacterium]|nr:ATP-binding protein [Gammaproteobacteria bacterium]